MERDADGFLLNTSDWSPEIMEEMAKNDGFEITDQIKTYIMKAREMYNETGTVPAVRVFAKEFGMDRKAKELYDVFESGPMKKIAKYNFLGKLYPSRHNILGPVFYKPTFMSVCPLCRPNYSFAFFRLYTYVIVMKRCFSSFINIV